MAYDLRGGTAVDVAAIVRAQSWLDFLVDAEYGNATYGASDPSRVYCVYRTTTGIMARPQLCPKELAREQPLAIDCGTAHPVWRKVVHSVDQSVVALLKFVHQQPASDR